MTGRGGGTLATDLSRAAFLRSAVALALAGPALAASEGVQKRPVPSSGELLPVVGCGTWKTFDVAPTDTAPLADVLRTLFDSGGSVIDTSPMYGRSEEVLGGLLAEAGSRSRAFVATKVWTTGREAGITQMARSMALLRTDRVDLMQVHNLLDWKVHLATLKGYKEQGRVRYVGVTHYTPSAHAELEAVLGSETLDFVQLNYAVDDRAAEDRLLPFARDRGVAVIVNQPFGGGGLLRRVLERPLPAWAGEIGCTSWAQLLLKFVLANPAVTCVIPGTGRPDHMRDNLGAGVGVLPDKAFRDKIAAAIA